MHTVSTIKHTFAPYRYILQNQSIAFQLRDDCIHIWINKERNRIGPAHMSYCNLFGFTEGAIRGIMKMKNTRLFSVVWFGSVPLPRREKTKRRKIRREGRGGLCRYIREEGSGDLELNILLILYFLYGASVSTVKKFRTLFSLLYSYLLTDYKNGGFVREK